MVVTAQRIKDPAREASDEVRLTVFPSKFKIGSVADFQQFEKASNYRDWLNSQHQEFLITCSRAETQILEKVRRQATNFSDFILVKRGVEVFAPQTSRTLMAVSHRGALLHLSALPWAAGEDESRRRRR